MLWLAPQADPNGVQDTRQLYQCMVQIVGRPKYLQCSLQDGRVSIDQAVIYLVNNKLHIWLQKFANLLVHFACVGCPSTVSRQFELRWSGLEPEAGMVIRQHRYFLSTNGQSISHISSLWGGPDRNNPHGAQVRLALAWGNKSVWSRRVNEWFYYYQRRSDKGRLEWVRFSISLKDVSIREYTSM